ncbi:Peptidoglycan/LPS O-acetylase OafA/YrhL, contains acyltransferase and SGNH-hydrolase domains [Actinacidiphila yanglinensis]|uniref:Peptidoglycan/LPS O-acetylase OafA/YrhL, contains acyltransferase and SGNH-hydrolase domains n=1 Tax=Actinacidiphila yanglinensis TaxID=310779 RepID=A0A1H5VP28_9ACTN|nr:acyltransferase [Actinacidiphila yanglinensis]SEF88776.1 Peptidoglycan/LPS O-acetylase OafA/YrhL, contains acyltransferase and SGNH-hydrolase domains [Actinacidiphila yanglinensis]
MNPASPPSLDQPPARALPAELPAPSAGAATAPPSAPAPRGRLRALDGLRLLAALMVCSYHYAGRGGDIDQSWGRSPAKLFPHLAGPFSYGCLGVEIFFVISGFVICMSGWGRDLKGFVVSRATRLYPAYWAALVLVTVVLGLAGRHQVSRPDLLTNFTMLQMPAGAERVLGVCWTLWAEMRFYLLFALAVVWPGATRRRVLVFCGVWTVLALYAQSSGEAFAKTALMPEYAPFFVAGMGLYLVYRFGHDAMSWGVVAVGFLLGQREAVKANVAPAHMEVFHHRTSFGVVLVVALGFAAVAAVTLVPSVARLNWRWLTTAGALTYPFYLVHDHLGIVAIAVAVHSTPLPPLAVLLLVPLAMLVLAWLLHRLVEKPLAPRLKRVLLR